MLEEVTLAEFLDLAWELYPLERYPQRLNQIPQDVIDDLKKTYKIKKGSK